MTALVELQLSRSSPVSPHQVVNQSELSILSPVLHPMVVQLELLAAWCGENLDLITAGRQLGYPYGICIGMSPQALDALRAVAHASPIISNADLVLSNILSLPFYRPDLRVGVQSLTGYRRLESSPLIGPESRPALLGLFQWMVSAEEMIRTGPQQGVWFGLSIEVIEAFALATSRPFHMQVCRLQGAAVAREAKYRLV